MRLLKNIEITFLLKKLSNFDLNKFKNIYISLLIGKILFLPVIYALFLIFDSSSSIFFLGDITGDYEKWERLKNLFQFGEWAINYGFRLLVYIFSVFTPNNFFRYSNHALISLILMCLAQTLLIKHIFIKKRDSKLRFKVLSILFSIFNFYILIYSFRPSADVFGCLGVVLIIIFHNKVQNNLIALSTFKKIFLIFLLICIFRNLLFLSVPVMFLSKNFRDFFSKGFLRFNFKNFTYFLLIVFLITLNIFQIASNFMIYISPDHQTEFGLNYQSFELSTVFIFIKSLFIKIIFLLSAREKLGMQYFLNPDFDLLNLNLILPTIFLLVVNILGLISIFKVFDNSIRNAFLFSLIPIIPVISFVSHHRYFLPYSLLTNAAIPFLFEKNKNRHKKKILEIP